MAEEKLKNTQVKEVKTPKMADRCCGHSHKMWLGLVLLTLLVLGLLCAAFVAGRHTDKGRFGDNDRFGSRMNMPRDDFGGRAGGMRGGMMGANDSATRVTGVVTAIHGDTLTVAGNGTTKAVKVTTNTIYVGAAKPAAVNDTIVAIGTASADTADFNADRVMLTRAQ
ncbi:MAG: hypothetical protein WAQ24_04100 [Candidatus Saccharimonadales bacterium]